MRLLVTGDRLWTDRLMISQVLSEIAESTTEPVTLIHGAAKGADSLAADVAVNLGWHVEVYPADWESYGKAAGPIRNQQMLDQGKPECVIAFHHDLSQSKGTADMVMRATKAGILVLVYPLRQQRA